MLLFKKRFLDAIRAGTKTQTIRRWPFRRMRTGQRSYIPGAGYIDVEGVDEVAWEDLTEEDARWDGFDSLAELREELGRIYDSENEPDRLFRVRFRLLDEAGQAAAKAEKAARRATSSA